MQSFGSCHLRMASPQQCDLLAPIGDQSAKVGTRPVESAWSQLGQSGSFERCEWIPCMDADNTACIGMGHALLTQTGHLTFRLRHTLRRVFRLLGAALQSPVRLVNRIGRGQQCALPCGCVSLCGFETVGVFHSRARTEGLKSGLLALEREFGRVMSCLSVRFLSRGYFKSSLRFAA